MKPKRLDERNHPLVKEVLLVNDPCPSFDVRAPISVEHEKYLNWQLCET